MLLYLGRYTSVEAALEGWPKVRHFASQHCQEADRLKKEESSFERTLETHLEGGTKGGEAGRRDRGEAKEAARPEEPRQDIVPK